MVVSCAWGAIRNGASSVIARGASARHGCVGSAPPGPFDDGSPKSVVTSPPCPFRVLKMWKLLDIWSTTKATVPSVENSMSVALFAPSTSSLPTT